MTKTRSNWPAIVGKLEHTHAKPGEMSKGGGRKLTFRIFSVPCQHRAKLAHFLQELQ